MSTKKVAEVKAENYAEKLARMRSAVSRAFGARKYSLPENLVAEVKAAWNGVPSTESFLWTAYRQEIPESLWKKIGEYLTSVNPEIKGGSQVSVVRGMIHRFGLKWHVPGKVTAELMPTPASGEAKAKAKAKAEAKAKAAQ